MRQRGVLSCSTATTDVIINADTMRSVQIPQYYLNRQPSSANRNAISCGTAQQGILLPVSEMSQCTGSKYPAEI